jgi:hypothetical protein
MKLFVFAFILLSSSLLAQHSEIGIISGASYYIGEINPSRHLINKAKPAIGLFYRKNSNKRYSLRGGINYASLSATDEFVGTNVGDYRALTFLANLLEGYGVLEFNFMPYQINNGKTSLFTPYVFIGLAVFHADIAEDEKLEGQVKEGRIENVTSPSIPFGLGLKFNFIENLGLGVEWGLRKTFTDQLDGLPSAYFDNYQLSNSQNKDWYSIVGLTLNYKFLTKRDNCPGVIN